MSNNKNNLSTILVLIFNSLIFFGLQACNTVVKTADRPELNHDGNGKIITERNSEAIDKDKKLSDLSDKDLEKYAYEIGLDASKPLSESDRKDVLNRRKLRQLERTLDSQNERLNYSKIVPLLTTDQEKIDYLSIPSIEGRKAWVNRNKIWNRDRENPEFQAVVDAQDLTLGMTQDLVRKSWGEPANVEPSGNPIYKNERWKYVREVPTVNGYKRERRFVYFEGGRVVGWETE